MGKQTQSQHPSAPTPTFGAGSKRAVFASKTVGIGQTGDVHKAFKTKSLTHTRIPAVAFPRETVRHQHDKLWGENPPVSPGPCAYDAAAAFRRLKAKTTSKGWRAPPRKAERKNGRTPTNRIYRW